MTTYLFASNQTNLIRAKAKQIDNIVKAKILFLDVVSPPLAKFRTGNKKNAYFIKHVYATIGEDIVYDISLTHTFRQDQLLVLKFNFIYEGRGDTLNFFVTDNKDIQTTLSIKIKNSLGENSLLRSKRRSLKSINYWKKKPKLWNLTNTEEAIKELYGTNKGKPNVIDIAIIKLSEYGYYAPIKISSKAPMKSISIFSDDLTNVSHRGKIPSVRAIISLPYGTTINYSTFYILTSGTCCEDNDIPITVAGIDTKGRVYKTILNARLVCSADCEM
jgi:hypothetical protein